MVHLNQSMLSIFDTSTKVLSPNHCLSLRAMGEETLKFAILLSTYNIMLPDCLASCAKFRSGRLDQHVLYLYLCKLIIKQKLLNAHIEYAILITPGLDIIPHHNHFCK